MVLQTSRAASFPSQAVNIGLQSRAGEGWRQEEAALVPSPQAPQDYHHCFLPCAPSRVCSRQLGPHRACCPHILPLASSPQKAEGRLHIAFLFQASKHPPPFGKARRRAQGEDVGQSGNTGLSAGARPGVRCEHETAGSGGSAQVHSAKQGPAG